MKRVALDPRKCMACRSCEVQCSVSHSRSGTLHSALFESPPPLSRVRVSWTPGLNVPVRCLHCETAPCLLACPVGAIGRDEASGTVTLRSEKCIGCFTCLLVCPCGAVRLSWDRKTALKCDGCRDRVAQGLEPACSASCPTRALVYREIDEIVAGKIAGTAAREAAALAQAGGAAPVAPSALDPILKMREEASRGSQI